MLAPVPKVGWYMGPHGATGANTAAPDAQSGNAALAMYVISKTITINTITIAVDTADAANSCNAILYSSDTDGYPSTLVAQTGAITTSATGRITTTLGTAVTLTAGVYWAVLICTSTTTVRVRKTGVSGQPALASNTNDLTAPNMTFLCQPGTVASPNTTISSWSDNFSGSNNSIPIVILGRSA